MDPISPLPLRFDASGLVPAVIQDADRDEVLMLGFMNEEALTATRSTGRVHFWSRGRNKLWRKGETSGHEQVVETIAVNCELNSLLIRVHQVGAVCHDGYDTCYYRTLEPNNGLVVRRDRVFDPATVYGHGDASSLPDLTRAWMECYAVLRDHDLASRSATSRRLRAADDTITHRIAEELGELIGVLNGSHRHTDLEADIQLEASQVIYWVVLACLRRGIGWPVLRPDRAFITTDASLQMETLTAMLDADVRAWRQPATEEHPFAARCHATLSLVAQACVGVGIDPREIIAADLRELRSKPYLQPVLTTAGVSPPGGPPRSAEVERTAACP